MNFENMMPIIWDMIFFIYQFNFAFIKSIFDFFRQFISPKTKCMKNEIVLITGGAQGIGQLLAIRLGKLGATIVIWDINENQLPLSRQKIEDESGAAVYSYVCNVSSRDDVFRCAELVKSEVGSVTMLINNAGIIVGKTVLDISDAEIKRNFGVNTFAHFYTCQAFLPDMIDKKHGHVVAVSSVAGHVGVPRMGDYSAAKAAASCIMETLGKELKVMNLDQHIFTTTIQPYFILTDMFKGCRAKYNLFKPISPEYAAERMVQAILSNQKLVMIGREAYLFPFLKSVLPNDCFSASDELLGNYNFMDTFHKQRDKSE